MKKVGKWALWLLLALTVSLALQEYRLMKANKIKREALATTCADLYGAGPSFTTAGEFSLVLADLSERQESMFKKVLSYHLKDLELRGTDSQKEALIRLKESGRLINWAEIIFYSVVNQCGFNDSKQPLGEIIPLSFDYQLAALEREIKAGKMPKGLAGIYSSRCDLYLSAPSGSKVMSDALYIEEERLRKERIKSLIQYLAREKSNQQVGKWELSALLQLQGERVSEKVSDSFYSTMSEHCPKGGLKTLGDAIEPRIDVVVHYMVEWSEANDKPIEW